MAKEAYHQTIRDLSDRIVQAQRPIQILDVLKWDPQIEADFHKAKGKELPKVGGPDYYAQIPVKFDFESKIDEFGQIERDIRRHLGQFNGLGTIMQRMCREYSLVIEMLRARGTPKFSNYSEELYGSSTDAFYPGAPTLRDLAVTVTQVLASIDHKGNGEIDKKRYSSEDAVRILGERLRHYFVEEKDLQVVLSDNIIADAAAGAECIKIRTNTMFSDRDLRLLEVHEGWVHLGTTMNGVRQPICTFLSKGPPSSTVTQEGLATIMEIFTFTSHPGRVKRLINRITAIHMAENGANFLEVYQFFKDTGMSSKKCYAATMRVFRGSTAEGKPFTKDLVYTKGFIMIYNYIRLAIQQGLVSRIPLLFLGKTTLEDLHIFQDLVEEGIVVAPKYIPPQFQDLGALSSWMCFSLFLNQLDLKRLAEEYKGIL